MTIDAVGMEDRFDFWTKFDQGTEKVSQFLRNSADKIALFALVTLNLLTIALEPWFFLGGFLTTAAFRTADSLMGYKISQWFNRLLPEDPAKKNTILSLFAMISFCFSDALFAMELAGYSGIKAVDFGIRLSKL